MASLLLNLVNIIILAITVAIIAKVFLAYFIDPYHPVRLFLDRLVNPLLRPIQRILPPLGGLDISPLILIIIIQLLGRLIYSLITHFL